MGILLFLSLIAGQPRIVESVVPSLVYSPSCATSLEVSNLGDAPVEAAIVSHRETGALVPLVGKVGMNFLLAPGERKVFTPRITDNTGNAWIQVREVVPEPYLMPVLSVGGTTACIAGEKTRQTSRDIAHPVVNPWYDGEVIPGARLAVVNTSESPVVVKGCYSHGTLVNNPNVQGEADLKPLCSNSFNEQIPPLSAKQFPFELDGNTHFSLHARGQGVVLQVLRMLDPSIQLYQVDSSIAFGSGEFYP